jgi:hypothetical protein
VFAFGRRKFLDLCHEEFGAVDIARKCAFEESVGELSAFVANFTRGGLSEPVDRIALDTFVLIGWLRFGLCFGFGFTSLRCGRNDKGWFGD